PVAGWPARATAAARSPGRRSRRPRAARSARVCLAPRPAVPTFGSRRAIPRRAPPRRSRTGRAAGGSRVLRYRFASTRRLRSSASKAIVPIERLSASDMARKSEIAAVHRVSKLSRFGNRRRAPAQLEGFADRAGRAALLEWPYVRRRDSSSSDARRLAGDAARPALPRERAAPDAAGARARVRRATAADRLLGRAGRLSALCPHAA